MKQYVLFLVLVYFWVTRTFQILVRSDVDSQKNARTFWTVYTYIPLKTICEHEGDLLTPAKITFYQAHSLDLTNL